MSTRTGPIVTAVAGPTRVVATCRLLVGVGLSPEDAGGVAVEFGEGSSTRCEGDSGWWRWKRRLRSRQYKLQVLSAAV
jgi:hypothetical protein